MDFNQSTTVIVMPYPFETNKLPNKERLTVEDIIPNIQTLGMVNDCFPNVRSKYAVYISGVSIERWNDIYECLFVYCCEFQIPYMFFIWNEIEYVRYNISDFNWKRLLPINQNFLEILTLEYNLGVNLPLLGTSVRNSIINCQSKYPYQIYISPGGEENRLIPPFGSNNIPAFDIVKENNLRIYCHSTKSLNIARIDCSKYIKDLLIYCTANCIKGAVFNCGTNRDLPFEEAKRKIGRASCRERVSSPV